MTEVTIKTKPYKKKMKKGETSVEFDGYNWRKPLKVHNDIAQKINTNIHELLALYTAEEYLERELNIPNIKGNIQGGYFTWGEEPVNYWKYAFLAILIGILAGMILLPYSDTFQDLLVACTE